MHLWDLSAYLPAGHVVLRMESFGLHPTRNDVAYALDRAGYRAAGMEVSFQGHGPTEIAALRLPGEHVAPLAVVLPTWRAWCWYVGYLPGVVDGEGTHAQACRCPNCGARLTGPAPAEGGR